MSKKISILIIIIFVAVVAVLASHKKEKAECIDCGWPPPGFFQSEFGTIKTLSIGQEITFSDGLKVTLKKIADSRCKPAVQCIWAGELGAVLTISGGKVVAAQDIYLAPSTPTNTAFAGYTFVFKNASETSVDIVIESTKP